ncbi:FAD:protein FMN transferase [Tumebacillus sp. ITR2]|uniref:FAD:protein FMN transferase n=1 Tax=Tumebacillus amylolyticus TaxID=2801339 RepID=A0ABS1J6V9_9BACL|nr:FAD:protein FMN transferase [Tumebacillus amylolyticus]MBL0385994.1 FAD:protein FMN transferase [Tumebacillus amylolyticus]
MTQQNFSFRAMNTNVEICFLPANSMEDSEFTALMTDVQFLFEQVEDTCSRFRPDSELSRLNEMAAQTNRAENWFPVSTLLCDLLIAAEEAYHDTDGIFNPGLLRHLQTAGYDLSFEKLQPQPMKKSEALLTAPGLPFHLNAKHKTISLQPHAQLDLGGIAKGWTVDRAVAHLRRFGAGFVNAGGDLRVFGQTKEPWNIGVEDPFAPDRDVASLQMSSGALATSSTVKRRWQQGSIWQHHLLDSTTGRPSTSAIATATVTAPTAVQADVWAKTVLFLGPERGADFLRRRNQQGVVVHHTRNVQFVK